MLIWLLLVLALALLGLGALTVVPAPDWSAWRLAVLAGEFGHWLAVAAAALAVSAWLMRSGAPVVSLAIVAVSAAAGALLLVPSVQAWRVGRALPEKLTAQFGAHAPGRAAFSVSGFLRRHPKPVRIERRHVAPGLPLDFYRPARTDGRPAPCVVVVHGGGWDSGDRAQLPELNHWLARRGYAVAAISYRLAPAHRWPAQREDTLAAIAFLKANAPELGIDATRLVLLGRSAGGQIAQVVAYTANDPAIRGLVALYAPSDLYFGYVNTHEDDMLKSPALMRQFLGGPPETIRAQYESASALNFVSPQSPPTLLLHGRNDAVSWYRHSVRLEARLARHGVRRAYVALPWATHAFDYSLRGPGGQLTTFAVEWFLAGVTK